MFWNKRSKGRRFTKTPHFQLYYYRAPPILIPQMLIQWELHLRENWKQLVSIGFLNVVDCWANTLCNLLFWGCNYFGDNVTSAHLVIKDESSLFIWYLGLSAPLGIPDRGKLTMTIYGLLSQHYLYPFVKVYISLMMIKGPHPLIPYKYLPWGKTTSSQRTLICTLCLENYS